MTNFVGRETELKYLMDRVEYATSGQGSTIFISGEAGIGKTRLTEECTTISQSRGFKVLKGVCLYNSLSPYMPIREALRSGELEHLISSETPPKLETVFLITNAGFMISKCEREKGTIDSDIFTGMLTAVKQFVEDSIRQMGKIPAGNSARLGYGDFNILAVNSKTVTIVSVFTGRENEFLVDDMESVLAEVEAKYGETLQDWNGDLGDFEGAEKYLNVLFESEKYEGIDWTKDDPKSKQNNTFENVTRGLVRVAKTRPIILFLDDLQWVDPSTLTLLHYISRNIKSSKVLILGTYRPEDTVQSWDGKTHPLTDTMQLMNREGLFEKLELRNLKDDEVGGLIRLDLGKIENEQEFTKLVWKESQGNPLFVLELLSLLKDEKVLTDKDGKWILIRKLDSIDIPSRIHDVIARRLAKLLKEQKQLLESASVIGDVFSSDVLGRVVDVRRMELLKNLNEIEKIHGLIESFEKKYRFSHVKIREVLYNGLSEGLKTEYHLVIGDILVELYGEDKEAIADIGYHYYMAMDAKKAVPWLIQAIDLAKSRYANAEVTRCCKYALELMNHERWSPERIKMLETLGDIQELTGSYDESRKSYEEVLEAADSVEIKAKIHRKIGGVLEKRGEYDTALAELEKGKEIIKNVQTPELGRLISLSGLIHQRRGDYDKAVQFQNDALKKFESFEGSERDVATAFNSIGACHWYKGEYALALEFYEKSLKIKEKLGDQRGIGGLYNNIGIIFEDKGEYDKALEFYERSLKIKEKLGDQRGLGASYDNIGIMFTEKGEYDKALEFYEKSFKIREKLCDQQGMGLSYINIGIIFADKGDYDKAWEYLKKCLEISEKIGDKYTMNYALCELSEILLGKNMVDDAEKYGIKALELARQIGGKEPEGASLRLLGKLDGGREEWSRSEEKFKDSISVLDGAGSRNGLAMTYLEYGMMLKKKGDSVGAKEKLNEALKLFEGLKMPHKVKVIRQELDGL